MLTIPAIETLTIINVAEQKYRLRNWHRDMFYLANKSTRLIKEKINAGAQGTILLNKIPYPDYLFIKRYVDSVHKYNETRSHFNLNGIDYESIVVYL